MQNDELNHEIKLSELDQRLADIRKSLAQEHHWEEQQKQWKWVVVLGFVAILVNGFKSLWGG
ncbi:MAG: hypothetical protein ACC707_18430 [Thiohalomonadales bacterium]